MSQPVLSNLEARRLFLDRHALLDPPKGPGKGEDLLGLIERLGFVQLDSINTVARAHDLILFARRPAYRPGALKLLYERDKALFEHWTHDAAMIPMGFYPWWQMRREHDAQKLSRQWRKARRGEFEAQTEAVLAHIRNHGACCSSDVGQDEKKGSGGWWDWHPSKTALEYLWRSGDLGVAGRDGFRKRYDLTENLISGALRAPATTQGTAETINWCCNGALDRLGFASHSEIAAFWAHVTPAQAKTWCAAEQAAGRIIAIDITQADGTTRPAFARPDVLDDPALSRPAPSRLRVLSPFDPALRDRKRAHGLFGFNYRIEVFVPEAQRRFGYYVFPLLQGEKLVGRIDMKAFRDQDVLRVKALWPERGVHWGAGRIRALEGELQRLLKIAGVSELELGEGWLRPPAQDFL
ncbi:MAG: winged helix-turn-helix domain-containing protein [Sulfitobacter sp.]